MSGRATPAGGKDAWCTQCGKTGLPTRKRAEKVARSQRLRLYECPYGHGFHLGHRARHEHQEDRRRADTFQGSLADLERLAQQMRQDQTS